MTADREASPARKDALGQLAPTGVVRVAINIGNVATVQVCDDGSLSGAAADLADALGRWTEMPLEILRYDSAAAVMAADGAWDVAFLAADPTRADRYRFTQPYLTIEGTIAAPAANRIETFDDADRAGVSIGSVAGASYDLALQRRLKNATRKVFGSPREAVQAFVDRRVDMVAGIRESLVAALPDRKAVRLLEEPFIVIAHCLAVCVDRRAAADLLQTFSRQRYASSALPGERIG